MTNQKQTKPDFHKMFSQFTVEKIETIHALSSVAMGTSSTSDLREQLKIQNQVLGGTLSSLSRTKINGVPLVKVIAKDAKEGRIWQLNKDIGSREEIKNVTEDILSAVNKWRKNK